MKYKDHLDAAAIEQYASALNARARSARARGRLSEAALRDRILACGGICEWCGVSLVGRDFELDHIISLKRRGSHTPENLVVACPDCNRQKGQKHPARFAAEISVRARRKTALVAGILQHFSMESVEQASLFAEPASRPDAPGESNRDNSTRPQYRW